MRGDSSLATVSATQFSIMNQNFIFQKRSFMYDWLSQSECSSSKQDSSISQQQPDMGLGATSDSNAHIFYHVLYEWVPSHVNVCGDEIAGGLAREDSHKDSTRGSFLTFFRNSHPGQTRYHFLLEASVIYLFNAPAWLLDHLTSSILVPIDDVVSKVFIEASASEQVVATHFGMAQIGLASLEATPSQWRYTPKKSCPGAGLDHRFVKWFLRIIGVLRTAEGFRSKLK
ncbi:hypothetical protein TNCV_359101 [Trichonephila clavipes]|nr:hypothetical protein TNCV_359101 [Trichonephila clavipes]